MPSRYLCNHKIRSNGPFELLVSQSVQQSLAHIFCRDVLGPEAVLGLEEVSHDFDRRLAKE